MAGPNDAPPQESLILQQWAGLKNTVAPERLGPEELVTARNVDIDDVGQPRRRRGKTLVASGNWHSIWTAEGGQVYGVKNNWLGTVAANYTHTPLVQVGNDPLAYVNLGPDVFYVSIDSSGVLKNGVTPAAWGEFVSPGEWVSPVVNPTATLPEVRGRLLGKPPLARYLAERNGRIYLANDRVVWATELYQPHYVDKTRNFWMFESEVTGMGVVSDGLYVGTTTGLYFIAGTHIDPVRRNASPYGVLHGSMIPVPPDVIVGHSDATKLALLCMTETGLTACYDGGNIQPLTYATHWFPNIQSVSALFREQDGVKQYVAVADSRGTPTSNARIGDYVDAEIRRFSGA